MQLWCTEGGKVEEVVVVVVLGGWRTERKDRQILTNPLWGLMRRGVGSEVTDYI